MPGSRFVISSIALACAFAGVAGAASDEPFKARAAGEYAHQASDQVTVGAKSYDRDELIAEAFGKRTDLLRYGILPVLIVVENKRSTALDLRSLEINLVAADGRHAGPIAPEDLPALGKRTRPPGIGPRSPVHLPAKKNPLNTPELVERAFAAKMLPPGDSASGFFYFEAMPETGDKIYLSGLRDARSGKEILYFEFPLEEQP